MKGGNAHKMSITSWQTDQIVWWKGQAIDRQSEYKYKSSYEQVFFSWLVGNNDMHLKNFSLYAPKGKWGLTPAYDLLNVALVNPKDDEEYEECKQIIKLSLNPTHI